MPPFLHLCHKIKNFQLDRVGWTDKVNSNCPPFKSVMLNYTSQVDSGHKADYMYVHNDTKSKGSAMALMVTVPPQDRVLLGPQANFL